MYVSVRMVLLAMCSFMFVSSSDGTITITGSSSEQSNGEKMEIYGSNRSSISCYITEDCRIPPKFNGPFVGKPANFRVEHTFLNRTIGSVPVAVFKWNPSTSGNDIKGLQGFQLIISPALGNEFSKRSCRIFDLKDNTFVPDDHKMEFKVTFPGLKTGENHLHNVRLSALPVDSVHYVDKQFTLPDVKEITYAIVTRRLLCETKPKTANIGACNCRNLLSHGTATQSDVSAAMSEPLAMDWTSCLSYQIQASDDMFNLTLNFTLAPAKFGFRSYYISLNQDIGQTYPQFLRECSVERTKPVRCEDSEDLLNIVREDATWATVIIGDVARGQYDVDRFRILIQPEDPDYEHCFVYQPSGEKEERDCKKTEEWFIIGKYQGSTTGPDATPTRTPNSTCTPPSVEEHRRNSSQGLQTWSVMTIIFCAVGAVTFVGVS